MKRMGDFFWRKYMGRIEAIYRLGPADRKAFQILAQKRAKEGEKVAKTFKTDVTVVVQDKNGTSLTFVANKSNKR